MVNDNIKIIDKPIDIQPITKTQNTQKKSDVSFKELLGEYVKEVNDLQYNADESIQKVITGEIQDIHQVMTAVQEADTAFKYMMQIRNKIMEAYQEISRMQV